MSKGKNVVEKHIDYSLLLVVIALVAFGFVMLYSTSVYTASVKYNDGMFYLRKQARNCVYGFIAMFLVIEIGYKRFCKFPRLIYLIGLTLCIAVIFVGTELNGSSRWLVIGGLSIQPSEIAKFTLIVFYATFISNHKIMLSRFKGVCIAIIPGLVVCFTVYNNLSTALILATIVVIMLYVAYKKTFPFIIIVAAGAAIAYVAIFMVGYRQDRIEAWLNPESSSKGYQTLQGLYAIGSGGLFGKGLGESLQKLGNVPEAQNDMIFSIICEELGVAGGIVVILMFLMLLWRLYQIAIHANTMKGAFIAVGIMAHISLQVILNIAVVTNLIPNTGVTLPFISYGGTSVLVLLAEMGLALSVSKDLKPEVEYG